ncbi:MAG TPA: hypothetical protein VLT45_07820 [Kofleriaceae bacterium]|nr:hypothetical protein [Kofleriaceae bacterium]
MRRGQACITGLATRGPGTTLLLLVAACSSTSTTDLSGVYMVTADVSSAPCGSDTPEAMPPAYVKFSSNEAFGATFVSYVPCSDAAATMCDSFGESFSEPIPDGWRGTSSSDSVSGSLCTLGYFLHTAVLNGKMLVIEVNDYSDTPMLDAAHCTTAEAEKRGTSMPCEMHERIEATKL